jgi:hypothetical protein
MRSIAPCVFLIAFGELSTQLAAQTQEAPAMANVQIVNATSVPVLSLRINQTLAYDTFPQGKRSGDAAVPLLEATYEAEERQSGTKAKSERITYAPGAYQSLVILGDFSRTSAPGVLRQPDSVLTGEEAGYPPNVLFQVYPHTLSKAPVRLRIINGMPGKHLAFVAAKNEVAIKPGECAVLEGQPARAQYTALVDGERIPLLIRQEGLIRNAIIVFFLKDGVPTFMRAFENNAESKAMRAELEKARE